MKESETKKSLLIGIGNSSREDDGLGWEFVNQIQKLQTHGIETIYKFQLNIEDAELISHYEQIFFADACKLNLANGFSIYPCEAIAMNELSTHSLKPEYILYLCQELYTSTPDCWIISIEGYTWELKEGISQIGRENLSKAVTGYKNKFHQALR